MKKVIFTAIIAFAISITSCDYVSNPYPERNANIGDTASCPSPTFPVITTHTKKILIEDYTGHACPNCPRAARNIDTLETQNPGKIIALAIHAGGLSAPLPGHGSTTPNDFLDDYRSTPGNTYDPFFKCSTSGLPSLLVNRKDYDAVNLTHLKDYRQISSIVSAYLPEASVVDLQLSLNYDSSTRKICCAVRDSFLTAVTGTYKLVVVLAQDSIIGWQDDVDHGMVPNYVFNHMLRDAITPTGAWGEPLVTNSAAAGTVAVHRFAYIIPSDYRSIACVPKNCRIIAFIYNTATQEIIQSEEAKIIP